MRKLLVIIAALLVLPAMPARGDGDKPEPLAIVVKKGSSTTAVSATELLKIFRGEETKDWSGSRFILTMREGGSPERATFLDQVMHMSESEYQKYFLQAMFTGLVKIPPKVLSGPDALRDFINNTDGAIGYMKLSDVDASLTIVSIDGKKPGDDGYPLVCK